MAARRRTDEDLRRMREALKSFDRETSVGEPAAQPDIDFHLAIAAATQDPHFVNLIDYFGRLLFVPGRRILFNYQELARHGGSQERALYMNRVREEHGAIISAIESGLPEAAREAMRLHLERAREDYLQVADELRAAGKTI